MHKLAIILIGTFISAFASDQYGHPQTAVDVTRLFLFWTVMTIVVSMSLNIINEPSIKHMFYNRR